MPVRSGSATVTSAGTPVALASTRTMAGWVTIHANAANGGGPPGHYVYIGGVGIDGTNTCVVTKGSGAKTYVGHPIEAGDWVSFRELGGPAYIDLRYIWVDADSDGYKITFNWGER